MDGVIYRQTELLPGAREFVAYLIESGTPFVFLTNNSAPTAEDLALKLKHLGIGGLAPRHFYTSAMNTAEFLAETHPNCTAFVLGEAGLHSALQTMKIPNDSISPTYVVVGEGAPSAERITKAHELIEKGARLVATNPDNWCPVGGAQSRPGAGALAAYLEVSTGQRAYFLGKPNPYMFLRARRRFYRDVREVMMVGDTMETDVRGAIEIGMQACLVLSGATSIEDIPNYVYQPTCVYENLAGLLHELRDGASERIPKSWEHAVRSDHPAGERHAEYRGHFSRPRPAMTK